MLFVFGLLTEVMFTEEDSIDDDREVEYYVFVLVFYSNPVALM